MELTTVSDNVDELPAVNLHKLKTKYSLFSNYNYCAFSFFAHHDYCTTTTRYYFPPPLPLPKK